MTISPPPSISDHASAQDAHLRQGFGPRVRRLHARIGKAHHQAEGMAFSRALLAGAATPLQLAALIRALTPAYRLLEEQGPVAAQALGARSIPWNALARSTALEHDRATLAALPATPASPAAQAWMDQMHTLAGSAPHRFMAHVYVRYGGDLSGGQQLAKQAGQILKQASLPSLSFWEFGCPLADLKAGLHDGFEELQLSEQQEQVLLEEAEAAFHATQRLLAELAEIN